MPGKLLHGDARQLANRVIPDHKACPFQRPQFDVVHLILGNALACTGLRLPRRSCRAYGKPARPIPRPQATQPHAPRWRKSPRPRICSRAWAPVPSAPTAKAYRGTLPYSICTLPSGSPSRVLHTLPRPKPTPRLPEASYGKKLTVTWAYIRSKRRSAAGRHGRWKYARTAASACDPVPLALPGRTAHRTDGFHRRRR